MPTSRQQQPKLLAMKISDAALALSVSPASVRRLIARGHLVPIRKLRHVLVTAESVHRFAGLDAPDSKGAKSAAVSAT
jgi:hypothetical protein